MEPYTHPNGTSVATKRSLASEGMTTPLSRPLRCATFNLLHGGLASGLTGNTLDLTQRLVMAAGELRRMQVDVIGLQEASTSPARGNVAARLAARLGYYAVYAPASCRLFPCERLNAMVARALRFTEGPAILSRFPIREWQAQVLPRGGRPTEPRVLLSVTLQTPWGQLPVASTHTSGKVDQHKRVAEILRNRRRALPTILMGDFNALEASHAMATLTDEAGFRDAFRAVHTTAAGLTCDQALYTPTPTVSQRIDYILILPGTEAPSRVRSSWIFLNAPQRLHDGRFLWPSDHYGVLAEIELFLPPVKLC